MGNSADIEITESSGEVYDLEDAIVDLIIAWDHSDECYEDLSGKIMQLLCQKGR